MREGKHSGTLYMCTIIYISIYEDVNPNIIGLMLWREEPALAQGYQIGNSNRL
jgi:hypothetical protein